MIADGRNQFRHLNRNAHDESFIGPTALPRHLGVGSGRRRSCPAACREARAKLPEFDAWDVAQVKGQRVGYAQTTLRLVEESGRQVAKVRQVMKLSLQRFGQETSFEVDYSDTETPDGVLLDFELVMKQGTTPMRTTGKVVGDRLELQIESQSQKQNHSVAWPAGAGGLLGPELSLRAKPLKPGEQRTVEHLNIDNQTCHHGNDGQRRGTGRIAGRQFPPPENRFGRAHGPQRPGAAGGDSRERSGPTPPAKC